MHLSSKHESREYRIGFFLADDYTWNFSTYIKTASQLKTKHKLVGTWIFQNSLVRKKGAQIPLWYLTVFGMRNFFIITLFALKRLFKIKLSKVNSWEKASKYLNVPHIYGQDPNSNEVYEWVCANNIDVIFILIGNILKKRIINAPTLGIINKHAAVLPSCKGLFPFFWARLNDLPIGVTFHLVDDKIDNGPILFQRRYLYHVDNLSMLKFYLDVFSQYPFMAEKALENLINHEFQSVDPLIPASYFGLPKKKDYLEFKEKQYCVARLSDIWEN